MFLVDIVAAVLDILISGSVYNFDKGLYQPIRIYVKHLQPFVLCLSSMFLLFKIQKFKKDHIIDTIQKKKPSHLPSNLKCLKKLSIKL